MAFAEDESDEPSEEYSSKPAQIIGDAFPDFSSDQVDALVEAMRQCCEEEAQGGAEPAPSKGKGKGPDLAVIFGAKPKR